MEVLKFNHGFLSVFHLANNERYNGSADFVLLVWNDDQIIPAEQYRKANFPYISVDIAVCQNPTTHKKQLGNKASIYHFSSFLTVKEITNIFPRRKPPNTITAPVSIRDKHKG